MTDDTPGADARENARLYGERIARGDVRGAIRALQGHGHDTSPGDSPAPPPAPPAPDVDVHVDVDVNVDR
jgi:hypothetical protein